MALKFVQLVPCDQGVYGMTAEGEVYCYSQWGGFWQPLRMITYQEFVESEKAAPKKEKDEAQEKLPP
jgi:hypothetical protein